MKWVALSTLAMTVVIFVLDVLIHRYKLQLKYSEEQLNDSRKSVAISFLMVALFVSITYREWVLS